MDNDLSQGIYPNISNFDYHRLKGISSSGISVFKKSPKKYWYRYLSGQYIETEKRDLVAGQALHTLLLEPDSFFQRFIIGLEGVDGRTKEGKRVKEEFITLAGDKTIVSPKDFDIVQGMSNSMKAHPLFDRLFVNGKIEHSLIWKQDDIFLKSRPDFYNDDFIVDVKTTREESPDDFSRSILSYGYHRQAAMQIDGLSLLTGRQYKHHILFVVEKEPPYLCYMVSLDEESINQGRIEYNNVARDYAKCVKENKWPAYSQKVETIRLPEWYLKVA